MYHYNINKCKFYYLQFINRQKIVDVELKMLEPVFELKPLWIYKWNIFRLPLW